MRRLLRAIGRLFLILLGYALALAAAAVFLVALSYGEAGVLPRTADEITPGLAAATTVLALQLSAFAFAPAVAAILFAELFARRDWLSHAVLGAATALGGMLMARGGAVPGASERWDVNAALIAAGAVGGLVYWALAGRAAGRW